MKKVWKQYYCIAECVRIMSTLTLSHNGLFIGMSLQKQLLCVICLCCFSVSANAELIFSAPPRESSNAGAELYGPLAEHLSSLLGEKVVYQHPKNWLQYQRDLRKGV